MDVALAADEYLHGTSPSAAVAIAVEGFRLLDTDVRIWGRGVLGNGIYVTKAIGEACMFGEVQGGATACLLRVTTMPGTRIARIAAGDGRDLDTLRREFGQGILDPEFGKAIPRNKDLKPHELFALIRDLDRRELLPDGIRDVRRWLRRLSFHGFGHPRNDLGIVLFDPSRVVLRGILQRDARGRWQPARPDRLAAAARRELDERQAELDDRARDPELAEHVLADRLELRRRRDRLRVFRRRDQ